jgi:DNA primase
LARFAEHFVNQVAQATDIVDLVSQHVALTRRGKEYVGLCPFHDDTRPSMYVSPAKQIFKCFACGAGGGVFQFLMLFDKLEFPQAIEALAERANIPLPAEGPAARDASPGLSKNDLLKVVAFAEGFYKSRLGSEAGKAAMDYALGRGLTGESIDRFGLGYAPDGWDALCSAARQRRIAPAQLVAAGLAGRREDGSCYDRFHNRLMFPIYDPQDRVVGFGGRALDPNERAKYINSPESVVFDKSGLLYGLNWARGEMASKGRCVVVEGYLDALMPLQYGVSGVVATMGTSLTDRHVRLLSRYAGRAVLVFDADTAGQAAAERALELFLAQRLDVRVATIPAGKDPCDYCLAEGGEAFAALIDQAPDALEYAWQRRLAEWKRAGSNLADRGRLIEEFLRLIVSSAAYGAIDGIRRGQLAQHIAHLLNVSAAELQQQMRSLARRTGRASRGSYAPADGGAAIQAPLEEREVLGSLLNDPELFPSAAERIGPEDFRSPECRRLAEAIWECGQEGRIAVGELLSRQELAQMGRFVTDLADAGQRKGNFEPTLAGAVDRILHRRNRKEVQDLKDSPADDDALKRLTRMRKAPDMRQHPGIQ